MSGRRRRLEKAAIRKMAEQAEQRRLRHEIDQSTAQSSGNNPDKSMAKPLIIHRIGRKAIVGMLTPAKDNGIALLLTLVAIPVEIHRHRLSIQAIRDNAWDAFLPWILILCGLFAWHVVKAAINTFQEDTVELPTTTGLEITKPGAWFRVKLVSSTIMYVLMSFALAYLSWQKASVADERTSIPSPLRAVVDNEPEPTLLSLFLKDFPNVFKGSDDALSGHWPDKTLLPIKRQVYLDFPGKSQFVGFYIPLPANRPSDRTVITCLELIKEVPKTIQAFAKTTPITAGDSGGVTRQEDLVFSGRVFIYHEEPLTNLQKAKIINAYNVKRLDVQFRGLEYLTSAKIEWHRKHDPKPTS